MKKLTIYLFVLFVSVPLEVPLAASFATSSPETSIALTKKKPKKKKGKNKKGRKKPPPSRY